METFWTDELIADVVVRIEAGESPSAIAKSLGKERSRLYRQLRQRGIELPKQGWSRTLYLPDEPTDLAYIAGIIDGEGTIMLAKGKWWHVKVGMTDRGIIEWLASFGGTFTETIRLAENRKDVYTWVVARNRDVVILLEALLPYLRVKRKLAEQALTDLHH